MPGIYCAHGRGEVVKTETTKWINSRAFTPHAHWYYNNYSLAAGPEQCSLVLCPLLVASIIETEIHAWPAPGASTEPDGQADADWLRVPLTATADKQTKQTESLRKSLNIYYATEPSTLSSVWKATRHAPRIPRALAVKFRTFDCICGKLLLARIRRTDVSNFFLSGKAHLHK